MELTKLDSDTQNSAAAAQLRAGFPTLRFEGPLEKEFQDSYLEQNLPRGRVSQMVALVLLLAVICIDFVMGGDTGKDTNLIRLGILCPILVVTLIATHLPVLQLHYMLITSIGVTAFGLVAAFSCIQASLNGDSFLLSGMVLVVVYACLFLGLLFNLAVLISAVLVTSFLAMGAVMGMPANGLFYTTAILATAAVIGALAAYNLEYALRTNFLETKLLNELAERDGLTGLYNRRIFDDYISRIWRQSRREDKALAVIFVDIDYFKVFNDLYGHQAGDDCLKRVAQTISSAAKRPFDFCARYGGEEFVLVLYGPPRDYAETLPEKIRRDVVALDIPHDGSEASQSVTVSVGVAMARPEIGRSLAGAIQMADEALYQAKEEGRNRVVFKDGAFAEVETGSFRVNTPAKKAS